MSVSALSRIIRFPSGRCLPSSNIGVKAASNFLQGVSLHLQSTERIIACRTVYAAFNTSRDLIDSSDGASP